MNKDLDKKKSVILVKNAQQHNLKGIDVEINQNSFTVVTGVSGSGKSSLVFDTLFAEGQRRYVESLSSYARQFMGRMKKPKVDFIDGLCPAVAIEQKVNTHNPRSTVATSTEIYDYLKLLFSRIGKTISPISGRQVKRDTVEDVFKFCKSLESGSRITILASFKFSESIKSDLESLLQQGFTRLFSNNTVYKINDLLKSEPDIHLDWYIVVDRIGLSEDDSELDSRLFDSIETAFWEGNGDCAIYEEYSSNITQFNNRFELDGITFEIPTKDFLSFNNPYGACKTCEGFGNVMGIDADLVIPDKSLSVYEDCIAPWKGEVMSEWKRHFIQQAKEIDFPIHRPYAELTNLQKEIIWKGYKKILGINDFFQHLEQNFYKIQYRVLAARYRGKTICPDCQGTRLRKEAGYVKLHNLEISDKCDEYTSIQDILLMQSKDALAFFNSIKLANSDFKISERIVVEIQSRLKFLSEVGLGYISLNRLSNTLSGGESQRINLATNLGSNLTGSLYVLDEPSIGLHSRDTERLINVLKSLQKEGNTVVVVEHDEDVMKQSDHIIDIGPMAGHLGGELVFSGEYKNLVKAENSLTAKFLLGDEKIEVPQNRRKSVNFIELNGVSANNLKNIDVKFPINSFTVVTGVSGSGKTSLIKQVLYPALAKELQQFVNVKTGSHKSITGAKKLIKAVELVDQNPIGKSSRSNPVTYVKAYDDIRELFANAPTSKFNGFKPSHFSFNVDGGRCDNCQGDGETTIEMQFMADIKLPCEVCNGKRFKKEVLEVEVFGKNIADILDMTVDESIEFFQFNKSIVDKLLPLQNVGLGYVKLGQGSNTLSGGEAQRVKLAYYLSKASPFKDGGVLYIFDEPTTGLHFHDIQKLLNSFNALIEKGNTIICIEHNLDVVKCGDWLIDLGPEAGNDGGYLVYQGGPEGLLNIKESVTAPYLKEKLI